MTMENGQNLHQRLDDIWERLQETSRKLWQEDSPVAVSLEAIIEEFRGEVRRVGQALTSSHQALAEQRESLSKEFSSLYSDKIRELESQIARATTRILNLERTLAGREAEIDSLLKSLADKEAENVKFHDEYLKAASHSDEIQAKKMEAFYQDLKKKEADLEATWDSRKRALEEEYRQQAEALKKKEEAVIQEAKQRIQLSETHLTQREKELRQFQDRILQEQMAWESKKLKEEEALIHRDEDIKKQNQDLLSEYKLKQAELQHIKEGMQGEIAELVRQYQAKLKGQNSGIPH